MRSVLCFGNAWLGGFMQKCVFQAVNSTHEWNTEWDASFCFLEKYLFFTDIQELFKQHEKRPRDIFASCFFFFAGG